MSKELPELPQEEPARVETPDLNRPVPPGNEPAGPLPEHKEEKEAPDEKSSRAKNIRRRGIRWTMVFLILFLLGSLAAIYLFYLPLREQANNLRASVSEGETSLEAADQEIADLENEVARLQSLQVENDRLIEENRQASLHIALLLARVDVATARVALLDEQPAQAQAALSKTSQTLNQAADLVDAEQREMVLSMQGRLQLAIAGIGSDPYASLSDLDVLSTNLLQLENTLFLPR